MGRSHTARARPGAHVAQGEGDWVDAGRGPQLHKGGFDGAGLGVVLQGDGDVGQVLDRPRRHQLAGLQC